MKHVLVAFALLPASAVSAQIAACPPNADIDAPLEALIAQIRAAPNEMAARPISNQMWELWTQAPNDAAQALLDSGVRRLSVADYDRAIEDFDSLVAYCPDYAEGYNQRAFARFLQGQYGLALEDLDLAIERSPKHVGALSGKALTLFGLGRIKAGQGVLREALEINPWLSERAFLDNPPGQEL